MKIGIHVDGPIIRGNERQVIRIAAGLSARGHEVVVSCRAGGPVDAELRALGIRTTGIRPRGDVDIFSALAFAWWMRREGFDAVLLTSWVRAFVAGWAASVARVPRVVFRIGAIQPIDERRGGPDRLALTRWYHAIIVNSRAVGEHMACALPSLAARIHTVVNGFDAGAGPAGAQRSLASALRHDLRVPSGALLAVAVGGLEHRKGYDLLVNAIARVPNLHVALVGGGQPHMRAALEQRAVDCGVGDRVHLLGRRTDISRILLECDLFVLPSRAEGFSVALLEAMHAGLPAISADVGGAAEALGAGDGRDAAGWIVPVGDVAALAAALQEVSDGLREHSTEVGRRRTEAAWRVANRFTTQAMVDGYEAVLAGSADAVASTLGRVK